MESEPLLRRGGWSATNAASCELETHIRSSLAASASSKVIVPPIALRTHSQIRLHQTLRKRLDMVCEAGPQVRWALLMLAPNLEARPLRKLCNSCAAAEEFCQFINRFIFAPDAGTRGSRLERSQWQSCTHQFNCLWEGECSNEVSAVAAS